jgi:capsular exopolysaccharide synthesis family protein
VLVVKKRPDAVTGVDTRELSLEDYVATHQTLIKSPLVVGRAVQKHDLGALPCLAGEKDGPAEAVIRGLSVTRNRGAAGGGENVLTLSFQCTSAGDCARVLSAVIDSYKDFLDETYRDISGETLRLIAQARDVLHKELLQKEAAYRKFRKETPLLLWRGKDGANLRQERLSSIEARRSALLLRKAEIRGQLAAIEAGLKEGGRPEALLAQVAAWTAQAEAARGAPPVTMPNQLYPLLVEEQKLLETRGENHPEVVSLRKRIELTRNFLAGPSAPWRQAPGPAGAQGQPGAADPVELYRQYCRQELRHAEVAEQLLADLFREEHDSARELTAYEVEDGGFRADIDRRQRLYDGIIKQLQHIDLVKDMGGYDARTISPPGAGKKVRPSALLIFPGAAFLGLVGGLALAFLAEIRDKSFRTAEEVRRGLGLPVLGHIPSFRAAREEGGPSPNGVALDPLLCAYSRPGSAEAEAYRGVRTALYFGSGGDGCKVVQITSPNEGDGKTLLAANLAVTIAQSGKRVVLVDADLRRPGLHRLFGLPAESGLASVLAGEAEIPDAVRPSGVPGLWVLPGGPRPPNPAELLTSPRLPELLAHLRERFDFVLVDTSALLAVSDPGAVAPRVDGVLLVVRVGKDNRPQAERARELLGTLKATVAGVVVNGAGRRGGYGYEEYLGRLRRSGSPTRSY